MYRKAVNYLRGQAVAEVVCTAPERVVNLCAAHGIPFWDLTWLTETSFRVTTTLSGARRLAEVTADIGAQVTVCRKSGAPELWRRCRHRYVLLAAALVLPLLLAVGSAFIWDFEVTGNDTVPTESVLQALERCGVRVGTHGVGLPRPVRPPHYQPAGHPGPDQPVYALRHAGGAHRPQPGGHPRREFVVM